MMTYKFRFVGKLNPDKEVDWTSEDFLESLIDI